MAYCSNRATRGTQSQRLPWGVCFEPLSELPLSYLCSTHNHLSTRGNQAEAIRLISEHVGIDTYLREGNIPDGYAEWKEKERERLLLAQNAPSAPPLLTMATAQCDQGETSSARTAIRATPTPAPAVGQAADR